MKKTIRRKILKRYKKYRNRLTYQPLITLVDWFMNYLYPDEDEIALKQYFKKVFGYELDLNNPTTFNEKMHWLKLNDRTELHTICADKLLVRNYVAEKIGEQYLVPMLFSTKKVSDITPESLPDYPTIIKTNHDSGSTFLIRDKKTINWPEIRKALKTSMRNNFYFAGREWPYKNIKPQILVEKVLFQKDGSLPNDYKFYCSNGIVHYIQVEIDRGGSKHSRNIYDLQWNLLDISRDGLPADLSEKRPEKLEEMIAVCEKLSAPFIFARVDLYYIQSEIYFGEITFTPGGGFTKFEPNEWDKIFGDTISLPNKN